MTYTALKLAFITLLCISLLQSFGQQNFQPGSVQKISGETVRGWIDYRAWGRNPKSIHFKESENGEARSYTVFDLSAFAVNGKESYTRAIVTKDMRSVELIDINMETRDSSATDTAFLRIITEGPKLNLYELNDTKRHYYIKDSTGQYTELLYKVYLVYTSGSGNSLYTQNGYREQLQRYLPGDGNADKLINRLKNARYNDNDLAPIINAINGNSSLSKNKTGDIRTHFFISGGASYSTLKTSGYARFEDMSYSPSINPIFGLGIDIVSKRQLGAFTLRFEALYSSASFKGNSELTRFGDQFEREYELKLGNFAPTLSFLYSPLRAPSYRVYAGAGLAYNFTSYSKNVWKEANLSNNTTTTEDNILDYEKSWIGGTACIGGIVKNFEFIFSGKIFGAFETFNQIDINFQTFSLRGAYRF